MKMLNAEIEDHKQSKMERLVKIYFDRANNADADETYDHHSSDDADSDAPLTSEDYHRRLLRVAAPNAFHTAMGQKSAKLQKAYSSAAKHYELVRTQGISDVDAGNKWIKF
jgi:hypothetical protein